MVLAWALVVATMVMAFGKPRIESSRADPDVVDSGSPLRDVQVSAQPTPPPSVSTVPSSLPSRGPSPLVVVAAPSEPPATAVRPAPTPSSVFTPIVIQAEDSSNMFTGGAQTIPCATCEGGARVGFVGGASEIFANTLLSRSGNRTVIVTFESDGPRLIKVSANGALIVQRQVTGPGWQTPMTFEFTASLTAGQLRLGFYNDAGPAPDIDMITIR
jgi:hypothetical protein